MGRIFCLGGGGYAIDFDEQLDRWWLSLAGAQRPRIAFIPTATGDSLHVIDVFTRSFRNEAASIATLRLFERDVVDLDRFLRGVDLVYVHGGNTASMLAVWRAHGLDAALKRASARGLVMGGSSAGAICWGLGGTTDSFGDIRILHDGLGLLNVSISPHHETEGRRPLFEQAIKEGSLCPGYGIDNGVGLLFEDGTLKESVSARSWARARLTGTDLLEECPIELLS
ncbi:MAG: peptidase E [Patescibacteria group bacterium]